MKPDNDRDQPAVSDVDVVEVAITIGGANRHGDKPDRHVGSVASSLLCRPNLDTSIPFREAFLKQEEWRIAKPNDEGEQTRLI